MWTLSDLASILNIKPIWWHDVWEIEIFSIRESFHFENTFITNFHSKIGFIIHFFKSLMYKFLSKLPEELSYHNITSKLFTYLVKLSVLLMLLEEWYGIQINLIQVSPFVVRASLALSIFAYLILCLFYALQSNVANDERICWGQGSWRYKKIILKNSYLMLVYKIIMQEKVDFRLILLEWQFTRLWRILLSLIIAANLGEG